MSHPLEYIITGALMKCSQGTVPMPFTATPRTSKIAGLQAGNALDRTPLINIPSFVICRKLTQMAGGTPTPCMPAPTMWQDTYPAKVGGAEALLFRSCINCPVGQGKIEFVTSGQLPFSPAISQQVKETQQEADEALKQAELEKNSVGEAGLLEGAIPIWGSGRDLIHAAQTGDKFGVVLNAAFLVWDVASVVAGVFTFGTATVAMAGAKAGVRTLLKASTKVATSMAKKKLAAVAAKAVALKNSLRALKPFGKGVVKECVTACFPAGTPIAVENDYCLIENIKIGDFVWSWEQNEQNLALKPVTSVSQREAHALVEVHVGPEVLRATPEHPFLLSNQEWKQAGQLEKGDKLLRSDRVAMEVREVAHQTEQTETVYNFEVADWHSYLVGKWMLIVHNGPCEDALKWTVGSYEDLVKIAKNVSLDAHHVGQKALYKKLIPGYDLMKGPSILVPKIGHTIRGPRGIVSRSMAGLDNVRKVLARDIRELRRVYPDIPNSKLVKIIEINKKNYPSFFQNKKGNMKNEDFVAALRKEVVSDLVNQYKKIYKTPLEDVLDPTYKEIITLYNSLNGNQQEILFLINRQVIIDTISTVLSLLDGASMLSIQNEPLELRERDGELLSGDLQDVFLRMEEEDSSLPY